MELTDEMKRRAKAAYNARAESEAEDYCYTVALNEALSAALEGYELAPFELNAAEQLALKVASGIAERGEPVGANTSTVLICALSRAVHTLAAKQEITSVHVHGDNISVESAKAIGEVAAAALKQLSAEPQAGTSTDIGALNRALAGVRERDVEIDSLRTRITELEEANSELASAAIVPEGKVVVDALATDELAALRFAINHLHKLPAEVEHEVAMLKAVLARFESPNPEMVDDVLAEMEPFDSDDPHEWLTRNIDWTERLRAARAREVSRG